jgi:hypothetical protein
MKALLVTIVLCLTCPIVTGAVLRVALDGSQQFTQIQAAIDASAHTDTVLVYPGRYFENVRFFGKNITLASMELITGDRNYIYSTIIDANHNGVGITCIDSESVITIRGFTVTNGTGSYNQLYDVTSGGGIVISMMSGQKSATIVNCLVTGNSADYGGGISNGYGNLTLSGVSIHDNEASLGGGLYFGGGYTQYTTTFDPVNRCSIYSNYAARGSDLFYSYVNSVHVVVDTFTVADPWNFYASGLPYNPAIHNPYTFDILHTVHEEVNHDLYVATWGDDSNSGLSPSEPMKSIFMAMYRIASDSVNPKKVYVADGIYSQTLNQQKFPIPLKSYTSLIGQSMEGVILNADEAMAVIFSTPRNQNVAVRKFTMTDCKSGISGTDTGNLALSDVTIRHIRGIYSAHGFSGYDNYGSLTLENVKVLDLISPGYATAVSIGHTEGSINLTDLEIGSCDSNTFIPGLFLNTIGESDVVLNRCLFHNNSNYTSDVMNTIMQIAPFGDYGTRLKVEINDSAFYNNYQAMPSHMSMLRALNDTLYVTNCTFAENTGGTSALAVQGTSMLTNNIFWNPDLSTEIFIPNYISSGIHSNTTLAYNNIRNGYNGVVNATSANPLIWGAGNSDLNPMFVQQGNHPYTLSSDSPLIDTGWQYASGLAEPGWDAGGNERVMDGDADGMAVIDIGAYEYQPLHAPENLSAIVSGANVWLDWQLPDHTRSLSGYRIYRNGAVLADITDPGLLAYRDHITQTDSLTYHVVALYGNVESNASNSVTVYVEIVGIDDEVATPSLDYVLACPNPFSEFSILRIGVQKDCEIGLEIFNLKGQRIKKLHEQARSGEDNVLVWNADDDNGNQIAPGIYLCRVLINNDPATTVKLIRVK